MKRWPWVVRQGEVWPKLGLGALLEGKRWSGLFMSLPLFPQHATSYVHAWDMQVTGWWLWCLHVRLDWFGAEGARTLTLHLALIRREPTFHLDLNARRP